jgi:hypothetical protein
VTAASPHPGADVYDRTGNRIGKVTRVANDTIGQQVWLGVRTGWFARESLVPLQGAQVTGDSVQLPYDKETIREAPDVRLDTPEVDSLYEHYRYDWDDRRAAEQVRER